MSDSKKNTGIIHFSIVHEKFVGFKILSKIPGTGKVPEKYLIYVNDIGLCLGRKIQEGERRKDFKHSNFLACDTGFFILTQFLEQGEEKNEATLESTGREV